MTVLDEKSIEAIDHFDLMQLEGVIAICKESRSLSEAGRKLFQASRERKKSVNDADRLKKYLERFEVKVDLLFGR